MNNGFSSPSTDEPLAGNPRVHEEGRENYERNNRSSDWFVHKSEVIDMRPEARLRSDAAKANALKNHGTVQEDLRGYVEDTHTINGRSEDVKIKTLENTQVTKDGVTNGVNSVIESYSNLDVSAKQPSKINTPEVEEHKVVEKVSLDVAVNHVNTAPTADTEQLASAPQPPTSLGLGGREKNVEHHKREPVAQSKGTKASKDSKQGRLHQESSGSGWDQTPPHHRLRADGEGIARKNTTDSINEIMSPTNDYPQAKEPNGNKDASETYTPRKPPPPRIRPDGLNNLQKARNHSEMSAIMHQSPVDATPPRPSSGRKILPHLQRSELW